MSTPRTFRSGDPETLRAIAHPLRMRILQYLDEVKEATATAVASHVGESVASSWYHLGILEKYGYLERGETRGREKPFRVTHETRTLLPDEGDPESVRSAGRVGATVVRGEADRVIDFLTTPQDPPLSPEWIRGVLVSSGTFWATADEAAELAGDITAILDRFAGREATENRPEGARRMRLFSTMTPLTQSDRTQNDVSS